MYCFIYVVLRLSSEFEVINTEPATGYPTNRQIYYPPDFVNPRFSHSIYSYTAASSAVWYKDGRETSLEVLTTVSLTPYYKLITSINFNLQNLDPGVYQCIFRHSRTNRIFSIPAFRLDAGKWIIMSMLTKQLDYKEGFLM